jgi:AraC family transcriptional regulator, ethanolamine operon transcriptional activator
MLHLGTMTKQSTIFRNLPLFDAFEQQSAQDWLPLEITQLSVGSYHGELRELQHNDVNVCFEHQSCMVHKRGVMDNQLCTVSFARSTDGAVRLSEFDANEDSMFFLPSGTEFDILVEGNVETVYFRFNQSQLLERARIMNPQRWDNIADNALIFSSINRKPLDAFAQHLYSHPLFKSGTEVIHDDEPLCPSIMDRILLTLDSSLHHNTTHRDLIARRRTRSQVTQAIDYINAMLESGVCPTILDICAQLSISQRNLQYSFKKILGLTPNAYLYHHRLNRVRAQLNNPANTDVTVTQVATHWHFWHLGRFANDYLQLFNELPSTTLRRSFS